MRVSEARAVNVWIDPEHHLLYVRLEDGRELGTPLAWFPRLATASSEALQRWELIGPGLGIHWEELDEDISVAGLLSAPGRALSQERRAL